MIKSLIPGPKLNRARRISDKNVKEFAIIDENPIIAYCLIQGTASKPYTVIIDMKSKNLFHTCPDFVRSGTWCKHIGKLLLKLSDDSIKEIYNNRDSINLSKSTISIENALKEIKREQIVTEDENSQNLVSLEDKFEMLKDSIDKGINSHVLETMINKQLIIEFENKDEFLLVQNIFSILEKIPLRIVNVLKEETKNIIKRKFEVVEDDFSKKFWITSLLNRLEYAYLMNYIMNKLKFKTSIVLEKPDGVTEFELIDCYIVLEMLYKEQNRDFKQKRKNLNLDFSEEKIISRLQSLSKTIKIGGTSVYELNLWLQNKIKGHHLNIQALNLIDEFLIYIMNANTEKPSLNIKFARRDFTFLSSTIINNFYSLKFIIERVKESEREYITQKEFQNHRRLFGWLSNSKDQNSHWMEKKRERVPDYLLSTDGLIIQWDINASNPNSGLLHGYDGNLKLIPDQTSSLAAKLQPFDLTLNHNELGIGGKYIRIAHPRYILVPEQAINLILQGIPIISNILPWKILSKYAANEPVSDGEINIGIEYCRNHRFIYGSTDLVKALTSLPRLGVSGLDKEEFIKMVNELRTYSTRLSIATKNIAKKILLIEGEELEEIFKALGYTENNKLKMIIKEAKNAEKYQDLTINLGKELVRESFKDYKNLCGLMILLRSGKLNKYTFMTKFVSDSILKYKDELSKALNSATNISRKEFRKNIVGNFIAEELNLGSSGKISDNELSIVKKKIKEMFIDFNLTS